MITLNSQPLHQRQWEIAKTIDKSTAKYFLVCCGRNFGKTVLMINILLKEFVCSKNKILYFFSQTYTFSKTIYSKIYNILKDTGFILGFLKGKEITLKNGSVLRFGSYNNYENLRGFNDGDRIFIDEAARIKTQAWEEVIKFLCISENKKAYLFSTPRGRNWFYNLYVKSLDNPNYLFLNATSFDNPYITDDEKENLRLLEGNDIYRQEVLAEFIESGGEVFNNLDKCFILDSYAKSKEKKYFMGVDLAKEVDYTVITILNEFRELVYFKRFNKKDYSIINDEIESCLKQYKPYCYIEKNNFGGVVIEQLIKKGYGSYIKEFVTTNETKNKIVQLLRQKFQEGKIYLTRDCKILKGELESFAFNITPSGNITYSAPPGMHDDTVISLALANLAIVDFHETNVWFSKY